MKTENSIIKKTATRGRNPLDKGKKKQQINLYVEQHKIETLGGEDGVREVSYQAIDTKVSEIEAKKSKKK